MRLTANLLKRGVGDLFTAGVGGGQQGAGEVGYELGRVQNGTRRERFKKRAIPDAD